MATIEKIKIGDAVHEIRDAGAQRAEAGKGLSTNDFSNEAKDKLAGITVPTALADLSEDSGHRTVSDDEKARWNSKYNKPGNGIPSSDMAPGVQSSLGKADTAIQPASLKEVTDKIPSQASAQNQLADKEFVNSSITTATASFKGTYNLVSDLNLTRNATALQIASALASVVLGADNNDYAFVQTPTTDATPAEIARIDRYKYNGTAWVYEYSLNNSSFTAAQWAAINSGITQQDVNKLKGLPSSITVPAISTDVYNDRTSDLKTSSPKAVYSYVHTVVGNIETLLAAI